MIIMISIVVSMQSIFGPIKTLEKSNETNDHVLGLSFKTDKKFGIHVLANGVKNLKFKSPSNEKQCQKISGMKE